METLAPLLLASVGLFCLAGAWKNWDWFMNNRRARLIVALLGRTGARWFYGLLGLGFLAVTVLALIDSL